MRECKTGTRTFEGPEIDMATSQFSLNQTIKEHISSAIQLLAST